MGRGKPGKWAAIVMCCVTAGLSGIAAAAARHGYVTGTARTECGRPVSSFTVAAYGFDGKVNVNRDGLPFLGQTKGHGGHYALQTRDSIRQRTPVNALVRSVEGYAPVSAHGQKYRFALDPTDGKPNGTAPGDFKGYSAKGIVRNFILRTSGLRPGHTAYRGREIEGEDTAAGAFYGANLILALGFYPSAGQTLNVSLVPTGGLVDGCPARTVTRTADLGRLNSSFIYLHSIPLTGYILTVRLNGTPLPLHRLGQPGAASSLPVAFPPTPELPDGSASVTIDAG